MRAARAAVLALLGSCGGKWVDGYSTPLPTDTGSTPPVDRSCIDADIVSGEIMGSTVGASDEVGGVCGGAGAPDYNVGFTAPHAGSWLVRVRADFDTVLSLRQDCSGPVVACSDVMGSDELLVHGVAAGDALIATVDGFEGAAGQFTLTVTEAATEEIDCSNGVDDDIDGLIDCDDAECAGQQGCLPACPMADLGATAPADARGLTVGRLDQHEPPCVDDSRAPDWTWSFTAPAAGTYTFSTAGSSFDTVLYVLDGCDGLALGCNDDAIGLQSELSVDLAADQIVVVVVDGYGVEAGQVVLDVE